MHQVGTAKKKLEQVTRSLSLLHQMLFPLFVESASGPFLELAQGVMVLKKRRNALVAPTRS